MTDGRAVDLYHKSSIKADLKDLSKFNIDGTVRNKVTIFNSKLKADIELRIRAMSTAYQNLCKKFDKRHISNEMFDNEVNTILNPEEPIETPKESMTYRFSRFIEQAYKENTFNEKRMVSYLCVRDSMERFLKIRHLDKISADEFTADMLKELYDFFADEYLYVDKHKRLYKNVPPRASPTAPRTKNTVITRMNKVQAFFNELLEREEIEVSPFAKLGRKRKASMMREEYDDPRFLRKEELLKILNTEVPETLQETKDAFLLQCALGCRISEFQKLTMDKVAVTDEGIPYVHYLPPKTLRENIRKEEIHTPIVKFALDIIKKRRFNFTIIKYPSGKSGYNVKIRQLLKHCGIDRKVKEFDATISDNVYKPLYEYGCNKICRATHEDMMNKVQINQYISGLHKVGSEAIHRYTMLELGDIFALMCVAFTQPLYKVDKDLNVIEDSK